MRMPEGGGMALSPLQSADAALQRRLPFLSLT
nr:MAG TPA: hypothetical protein [Bacteriophage sp.]